MLRIYNGLKRMSEVTSRLDLFLSEERFQELRVSPRNLSL